MHLYVDSITPHIHNQYFVYQIEYSSINQKKKKKKIWEEKRLILSRAGTEEASLTQK